MGASDYLVKPVDRGKLSELARKFAGFGTGRTALVVDDDSDIRLSIQVALTADGWNVEEAKDGQEALEHLMRKLPDILILDLLMPGKTGFDVIEEIRNNDALSPLPILVLTGKELNAEERQYLNDSTLQFMRKGGTPMEGLAHRLRRKILLSLSDKYEETGLEF